MLHTCSGKSLEDWYKSAPDRFIVDPGPNPWWHSRNFSRQRTQGSFLFSSGLLESTRYKLFPEQFSLLPSGHTIPSVVEVVDLLMSGAGLLKGEWTRTRNLILVGNQWSVICVGTSRTGLVDVFDYYAERKASNRVGLLPIQRLSKPEAEWYQIQYG